MPPISSLYQMADVVLGGRLEDTLRELYAEAGDGGWEQVSRYLRDRHQVVVTGQTLRTWARELGIGQAA